MFRYVEHVLDGFDPPQDATQLVASLPSVGSPHPYRAVWVEQAGGGAIMPDSRIGLTILGLHFLEPVQDVDGYLAVVRVLGHLYRLRTPDPNDADFPAIAWTLLRQQPGIPDWLKLPGNDTQVGPVLEHEPPTWGSVSGKVRRGTGK